ncbi:hypothetical protein, partial [Ruegeria atlantica]|uniref:hypothetical protein n=1 Tax=Ruegeria atlantica TaxID=81569 RepID=UPI001C2C73F0
MRVKTHLLSFVFVSATLPFITASAAQAERCNIKTARQSVSTETLCGCSVVDTRMLRYIQRRADFEDILARTLDSCPAFAAVLTDLPTASTAASDRDSDSDTFGASGNGDNGGGSSDDGGGNNGGGGGGGGNNGGGGGGGGGNNGGGGGGGGGNNGGG